MKSSRETAILLLMAMGLTMFPAPLDAALAVSSPAGADPCDTLPVDPCDAPACGSEPEQETDNCCDNGCQHCSLPCCSGAVMIPTVAPGLGVPLTAGDRLAGMDIDVTRVEADPLYHPPRR